MGLTLTTSFIYIINTAMTSVISILSFVLLAALASLAYYHRRIERADKAIKRLEAEIAEMDTKATKREPTDSSCKKICLNDSSLSLAAAAGAISKGKEFINNNNKTI